MNTISSYKILRSRLAYALINLCVLLIKLLPLKFWVKIRERASIVRKLDYTRVPIHIHVDTSLENDVRLRSCKKEPETVEWIEKYIKPGDTFYDIGANIGAYSLVAWAKNGGRVKVYAFEPGFSNYPQLCRNIILNRAEKSIVPLPVALYNRNELEAFNYQNVFSGGALHSLGAAIDQWGKAFTPVVSMPTACYRLDDLIKIFHIEKPNHIKIDVDGNERALIEGFGNLLQDKRLRSVFLEMVERDSDDMTFLMKKFEENGLAFRERKGYNYLFERNDVFSE